MQYMYQVRNTIAIDEEYHYKSNNFRYHKYAKGNEKNYAVCVSGEEYTDIFKKKYQWSRVLTA